MKIRALWQRVVWVGWMLIGLMGVLLWTVSRPEPPLPIASPTPNAIALPLNYQVHTLPHSTVHTLLIPAGSGYTITPAVAPTVASLAEFAAQTQAIAVLNGGFFDPENGQSTSYITVQGEIVANPQDNERLIENPDLAPYLPQILNRSEFRQYRCGQERRYDIVRHNQPTPEGCQLVAALGGGPQLLPEDTSEAESFLAYTGGTVSRDPLGHAFPNARSAIGYDRQGNVVWVMAAQKPDAPINSGLSLPELREFMQTLGLAKAMNLDGGSSTSLYYQNTTYHGKIDSSGQTIQRPVKSVLLLTNSNLVSRTQAIQWFGAGGAAARPN